ncbi:FAD-dependent monooxygenase [Parageobacillus toebii]|uniref:3-(3-hydroxy-phenyl)propionate hydroxylase n=1 Tax=Parageobacillus toebii NBRC 107807 TaxID=1223503 RepID=A0AA89NRU2_9BACL|nr:FAD-dependent monooxygenase [Parageobacillus toebii]MBB3869499.1 3-(3-hydroxy-phenyl)propionate hydroxylase [Parageobacillus toebii NBRC 107807]
MSKVKSGRYPVLVVGAGPIGLTAALALRHLGLPAIVIEAEPKDRLRPGSRAIYFHKATLQHLEDIFPGLGYTFTKHGVVWPVKRTLFRGKEVYVKRYPSPDPKALPPFTSLPQVEAEKFLYQACLDAGVEFIWGTPVKDVRVDEQGVTVITESNEQWQCDYVIAADGARSTVRQSVGIEMEGPRTKDYFVVVDVREDETDPLPLERIFHYQHPAVDGRNVLYVPFAGGWRIDLQLLEGDDPEEFGSVEGVKKWLPKVMHPKYADRITWVSTYRFYQVVAKSFTDAHCRVLLAGEAAHLFAPFGARGMNSGVPDAIVAAKAIHVALHASTEEEAKEAIAVAAEERRIAARYNRDCAGIALEHIQGSSPMMNMKREVAASLAPILPRLGKWLDEGPYGPKSGPPQLSTKY